MLIVAFLNVVSEGGVQQLLQGARGDAERAGGWFGAGMRAASTATAQISNARTRCGCRQHSTHTQRRHGCSGAKAI
jgi:hypothetical protein